MSDELRVIPMRRAAELMGITAKSARERLHQLDAVHGGILVRYSKKSRGRLFVNMDALLYHLRKDPTERDAELEEMRGRIEEIEVKLAAERRARHRFQKQAREWFKGAANRTQ